MTSVRSSLGNLRPTMALDVMSSQQTWLMRQVIRKYYLCLVAIMKGKSSHGSTSIFLNIHIIHGR
jgi:hypothetical protein